MKVVIINKSDSKGGAAVVSRRLLDALRLEGVDADMLVIDKSSTSGQSANGDIVGLEGTESRWKFLWERLKIFVANGFNRASLFKIDTGEEGLPLWTHPMVKGADAILLNWVNQSMLSLKGFKKILQLGKPVIWTMHDMWEMTGICHHAGLCLHYTAECGICPLLEKRASRHDLSHKIWVRKNSIYGDKDLNGKLAFVAVSNWLKTKASESSLLKSQKVELIPNAFQIPEPSSSKQNEIPGEAHDKIRILFGAARLDDPIKGLDTLREVSKYIKTHNPEIAGRLEIALFGDVKNPASLHGFGLPLINLGVLHGEKAVERAYREARILVSASSYETLPGTLVEAQAYGCIPVSFNQGGQTDIVDDGTTGFIADYSSQMETRVKNLSEAILKAVAIIDNKPLRDEMVLKMRESVERKFSYKSVAEKYIALIRSLQSSK